MIGNFDYYPRYSMPVIAATGKHRRKVLFSSTSQGLSVTAGKPKGRKFSANLQVNSRSPAVTSSHNHSSSSQSGKMGESQVHPGIPALFREPPLIHDLLSTETTELQSETVNKCLPLLKGIHNSQKGPFNKYGVPALQRKDHLEYLYDSLEDYPASFVALDASRPWMVYWALAGLCLLGEDVTRFRER